MGPTPADAQHFMDLCAASIRALSATGGLHFRGGILHRGEDRLPIPAPHLHPGPQAPAALVLPAFRGAADGMALRVLHSDARQHADRCPDSASARLVFEMLEQFRVESLAPESMPGLSSNLARRFLDWSNDFEASGMVETQLGMLLFTVAQVCRERICGTPMPAARADLVESTRFHLGRQVSVHLAPLRRARFSQPEFARAALPLAEHIGALCRGMEEAQGRPARTRARRNDFRLLFDQEDQDQAPPVAGFGRSRALDASDGQYRVFTRAFDRQQDVQGLVRPDLLRRYRHRLDAALAQQRINVPRLGRALRALLSDPVADGWETDLEEGRIDGSRLARLVTAGGERRVFRAERTEPRPHAAVTFLIDCSGSMKGHSESVAVLVDAYARALDMAGVRSEVLGFTTAAWNGGRAARQWSRSGRPANPGRLNETRHLIFKDADSSWRQGRHGIAGLLKQDLYREGVDGEAVDWACARLASGAPPDGASRSLLLVISDGSPMDAATARANDGNYLEHHLRDVVARHQGAGKAEILGLGVGLDLSPYYRRVAALDLTHGTTTAVVADVLALMARGR